MARKLSQLPLANAISDTDKFLMTRTSSGNSEAVSATAFKAYLSTAPAEANNILYVAPNGDDLTGGGLIDNPYKTINHAISQISGSSIVNRYVIECAPGIYAEDPIVLPQYVGINGKTNSSVTIVPNDINSPLISLDDFSTLSNLTINGVSNSIGVQMLIAGRTSIRTVTIANCNTGMYLNNASSEIVMSAIIILTDDPTGTSIKVDAGTCQIASVSIPKETDVLNCIEVSGSNSKVIVDGITLNEASVSSVLKVHGGATAYLMGSTILGDVASPIGKFIDANGVGTKVHVNGIELSNCDKGFVVEDGVLMDLISVDARLCGEVLEIGATGASCNVTLVAMSFIDSLNLDMNILSASSSVVGTANILADDKLNIVTGATLNISHYSVTDGDEGFSIKGELHVGSPDFPSESTLGEGDSYTRGLLAYSYDGASYSDISAEVRSHSGSQFTFPNNSINTAIYLASDLKTGNPTSYHQFLGTKMSMDVAQIGGSIVAEYWNGSAWVEVNTMTVQSSGKYYRQADKLFTADAGSYQILFDPTMLSDWGLSDDPNVDVNDRYWMRYRIVTSPSTLPVFQQFKLHSNRTEINVDGYLESFGLARSYVTVPVTWNTFRGTGATIANQNLWLSTNTPAGFQNNSLGSGDTIGTITTLPTWVDTSAPLKVLVAFRIANNTNDKQFTLTMNSSNDGSSISTSDPASTVGEIQTTVNPDLSTYSVGDQIWLDFDMDISAYGEQQGGSFPDSIWLNLSYDSGTGNMQGMQFELAMLKFRDGVHV